jgi:hypothetical protein
MPHTHRDEAPILAETRAVTGANMAVLDGAR